MSNANVSTTTIQSYAAGYKATNAVIDNTTATVAVAQAGVVEVATIATAFFSGIKFAINERRGIKPIAIQSVDEKAQAAAKQAAKVAALQEAIAIFNRGHEVDAPVAPIKARRVRGAA